MANTKPADIRLKEANAKFTRAKAAVVADPSKEKPYQKAKTELALARQAYAETRFAASRPGDGSVELKAVSLKAGTNKTRSNG